MEAILLGQVYFCIGLAALEYLSFWEDPELWHGCGPNRMFSSAKKILEQILKVLVLKME